MLNQLSPTQARHIAQLASAARGARERLLHGVADEAVNEPHPTKGELDRSGAGGFDVLPPDDPDVTALRGAIRHLRAAARSELFALMRIGQGELAAGDWGRGLSEAAILGDESIGGILADDIDLQSHLSRGLHQLGSA